MLDCGHSATPKAALVDECQSLLDERSEKNFNRMQVLVVLAEELKVGNAFPCWQERSIVGM